MKLNFNFIISMALAAGCAGGCRSAEPAAPPAGLDGGDAQRVVSLLDYVAGDYVRAVRDGAVLDEFEYAEQTRFASDARRLGDTLLARGGGSHDDVSALLARVEHHVAERADPATVSGACHAARDALVARLGLRTAPTRRPDLARAEALYSENCAPCHGPRGDADTDRARTLDPHPASFRDRERLDGLSPYRVYNALTFGVDGTAMASFAQALSPEERWALAFYVFRLGHAGEPAASSMPLPLADLAGLTDAELRGRIASDGGADPEPLLVAARRDAPFAAPEAGLAVEQARRLLAQAVEAAEAGRVKQADGLVVDAYLHGFEPIEATLAARDPEGVVAVEAGFRDLRGALASGRLADVRRTHEDLVGLLERSIHGSATVLPVFAAWLIYSREGLEAALLVAALLAGLRKLGRSDAARWVHAGWVAAIPAGVVTWWVADRLIAATSHQRELVEAVVGLLAAAVLFSVSFWMVSKAESRRWLAYLGSRIEGSLSRGRLALLAGVSFLALYREAAETILFTQALLLESEGRRSEVWLGAALGLATVVAAALLLGRAVRGLPLGPFFAVSGVLLCALAVSFAGSGMYTLVVSGYLQPRPVRFPEVAWMGIHPDLAGLLVQLAIVGTIGSAGVAALRRRFTEGP